MIQNCHLYPYLGSLAHSLGVDGGWFFIVKEGLDQR